MNFPHLLRAFIEIVRIETRSRLCVIVKIGITGFLPHYA
jgi:hypothetical protein